VTKGRGKPVNPIKRALRDTPVLGPTLVACKRAYHRRRFPGSATYWEEHYRIDGTSGPGSDGINVFPYWMLVERIDNTNPWSGDLEHGSLSDFYVYEQPKSVAGPGAAVSWDSPPRGQVSP
jgi:hypothetical protein